MLCRFDYSLLFGAALLIFTRSFRDCCCLIGYSFAVAAAAPASSLSLLFDDVGVVSPDVVVC